MLGIKKCPIVGKRYDFHKSQYFFGHAKYLPKDKNNITNEEVRSKMMTDHEFEIWLDGYRNCNSAKQKVEYLKDSGFNGISAWIEVNGIGFDSLVNIDLMHFVSRIVPKLVKMLKGKLKMTEKEKQKLKHKPLPKSIQELLDKLLINSKYISEISQATGVFTKKTNSREWLYFLLYHFEFVLMVLNDKKLINSKLLDLLLRFIKIMRRICAPFVNLRRLKSLWYDIVIFLVDAEKMLPVKIFTCYFHLLIHFPHQMACWGPPIYWNCYTFESYIGDITRKCRQFRYVLKAVGSCYQRMNSLKCMKPSLKEFYGEFRGESSIIDGLFSQVVKNEKLG